MGNQTAVMTPLTGAARGQSPALHRGARCLHLPRALQDTAPRYTRGSRQSQAHVWTPERLGRSPVRAHFLQRPQNAGNSPAAQEVPLGQLGAPAPGPHGLSVVVDEDFLG